MRRKEVAWVEHGSFVRRSLDPALLLLLLLHLLEVDEGTAGGPGAAGRARPARDQSSGMGILRSRAGGGFAGLNVHGNIEFAVGSAAEDAVSGRNVGVVAANGGADVAVVGDEVVGGIEADPS